LSISHFEKKKGGKARGMFHLSGGRETHHRRGHTITKKGGNVGTAIYRSFRLKGRNEREEGRETTKPKRGGRKMS